MIELPSLLIRQLQMIVRCAGLRRFDAAVTLLQADHTGITMQTALPELTIRYRQPGCYEFDSLGIPLAAIMQVKADRKSTIRFTQSGAFVLLDWWHTGVLQQRQLTVVDKPELLISPTGKSANRPQLLGALARATEVADKASARYALGCIRLDGKAGQLVATDGRQLLAESGFDFPWKNHVLIPRTRAFTCPVLPKNESVLVGDAGDAIVFEIGAWSLWLPKNTTGRFPSIDCYLQPPTAASTLSISPSDADFLSSKCSQLPAATAPGHPVTLDLNGHIAVRAREDDQSSPTELILGNSSYEGEAVRVVMDRQYLTRATRFGLNRLLIQGPDKLLYASGDNRCYAWMPLDASAAVKPSERIVQIQSSTPSPSSTKSRQSTRRKQLEHNPAKGKQQAPSTQIVDVRDPLRQIYALQLSLRTALMASDQLFQSLTRSDREPEPPETLTTRKPGCRRAS